MATPLEQFLADLQAHRTAVPAATGRFELKGAKFRNENLSGQDLADVDFIDCDFSGANLSGAKLEGTTW